MTGDYMGIAAVIGSVATLAGVLGNLYLQLKQMKLSLSNADKLTEIHAATTTIQEQTGVFKKIDG